MLRNDRVTPDCLFITLTPERNCVTTKGLSSGAHPGSRPLHNTPSAASLSRFGLGHVRKHTPFALTLSSLHLGHSAKSLPKKRCFFGERPFCKGLGSQVGLLTYLCRIGAFPRSVAPSGLSRPIGYCVRLTAAGTVPDSHRFPHLLCGGIYLQYGVPPLAVQS